MQISDTHVGAKVNRPVHERLAAAVILINALKPAFVIDTGDVATHPVYEANERNLAELEEYKQYVSKLKRPLYVVPGNHDIGYFDPGDTTWGDDNPWGTYKELAAAFKRTIGPLDQSFRWEDVRFVLLNNNPGITHGPGMLSPEQLRWIEAELEQGELTFIFCHVEVLENGVGAVWGESSKALTALCEKYGVPAVAYGHKHRTHVAPLNGTQYIMCPSLKVPGQQGILQWRIFRGRFELWLYDVFSGDGERLGRYPYPKRDVLPRVWDMVMETE